LLRTAWVEEFIVFIVVLQQAHFILFYSQFIIKVPNPVFLDNISIKFEMNLKIAFGFILFTATIHASIKEHEATNQNLSGEEDKLSLVQQT
jgi:hypothetical protein